MVILLGLYSAPIASPPMSISSLSSSSSFKFEETERDPHFSSSSYSATMDPTYVISGPGAVLQCLTPCSQSLAQLQHLQREYNNSPPATLEALTIEVRQVARSLSAVNGLFYDPEKDVAAALESNMDLQQLFDNVLRPTQIIFSSLEQEMRGLFLPAYDHEAKEDDTKARARYLFTDNVLKNYLSMVRTNRSILTMLTSALQMKTPTEITTMIMMSDPIIADINERASALYGSMESPGQKDLKSGMAAQQEEYFASIDKETLPMRTSSVPKKDISGPNTPLNQAAQPVTNHPLYGMDFKTPLSPPPTTALPSPPPPVPAMPTGAFANQFQSGAKQSQSPLAAPVSLSQPASSSPPLPEKSKLRGTPETQSPVERHATPYRPAAASQTQVAQQIPVSQTPQPQSIPYQNRPRTASASRGAPVKTLPNPPGIHPAFRNQSGASPTDGATPMSATWTTLPQQVARHNTTGPASAPIAPLNVRRQPSSGNASPPPGPKTASPTSTTPAVPSATVGQVANMQRSESRLAEAAAFVAAAIEANAATDPNTRRSPVSRNGTVSSTGATNSAQLPKTQTTQQPNSVPTTPSTRGGVKLFPSISAVRRTPSRLAKEEALAESAPEVFLPPHPAIPPQFASAFQQSNQLPAASTLSPVAAPSPALSTVTISPSTMTAGQDQSQYTSMTRPRYTESVYSLETAAAASSQALPSRNNSVVFGHSSATSGDATPTTSKPLSVVDFNVLIPKVRTNSANLPPRPDEIEDQLRREKDTVLASMEVNDHMHWAENVLRQDYMMTRFKKRLAKVGYQQVLPSLSADGLTVEAQNIIERNVRDGHPRAMFLKARWFGLEESVTHELYLSALSKGYLRAAFYLGKKYEAKKDFSTAFEYYRKGAYGQDSACGYRLAKIFLKGELGKKKDHKTAVPLLQTAASNADKDAPYAPYLLGMIHTKAYQKSISLNKKLVSQDTFAARAQITHAATLGLSQAMVNLGKAYARADNDLSLPEDHLTSLHYLYLASVSGESEADLELSNCFWWGQQGFWGPNEKIAYMYAKMSSNENHIAAFCQVGYFHERGIGCNIDLSDARAYYLKGASGGDKMAINRLDGLRRSGGKAVLGFQN